MSDTAKLLNQIPLQFRLPSDLQPNYAIVGDGAYTVDLYQYLIAQNLPKPAQIYVRKINRKLPIELQTLEKELQPDCHPQIVLGTNSFHLEILQRIGSKLSPETEVCDLLMQKSLSAEQELNQYFWQPQPVLERFILIVTLCPIVTVEHYLASFVAFLRGNNICVFVRHPLQPIDEHILASSLAVIFWNGSTPIFNSIKQQCLDNAKSITYAECGFFPQKRHFYFDRKGVNLDSQLRDDELNWLDLDAFYQLKKIKRAFFSGAKKFDNNGDYIFVPLQVPNDSNVQLHSRFTNGMQEFIDFVLSHYRAGNIIFKAHPKDDLANDYDYGRAGYSNNETRSLILGASKVVGINSSVLYEAALAGKTVECHGDSLLNVNKSAPEKILCAMTARQFSVDKTLFSREDLQKFSYLHEANLWKVK